MTKRLGWLHISDIHFLSKKDWRDSDILKKLLEDLADIIDKGIQIDLIFCTGDIGFGQTSTEPLSEQYKTAKEFFEKIIKTCNLENDRFFLVPGNHDIDRTKILSSQTEFFRSDKRTATEINQLFRDGKEELTSAMKRLNQYRVFVTENYPHIKLCEKSIFSSNITINEVKIKIAGFNSAWNCADEADKNNIWLAGSAQLHEMELQSTLTNPDIKIAMMHHPLNWLREEEFIELRARFENNFDFLLHGHTHDQWVSTVQTPYHIVIASGAAAAHSNDEFGYNVIQITSDTSSVHLRRYYNTGNGWGAAIIPQRAKDGVWAINSPVAFSAAENVKPSIAASKKTNEPSDHISEVRKNKKTIFGLDRLLLQLSKTLQNHSIVAVFGLAGVGKTALIKELKTNEEWKLLKTINFTVNDESRTNDLFGALASHLGIFDERPQAPAADSARKISEVLRNLTTNVQPFFLHIERAHIWLSSGSWKKHAEPVGLLLEALTTAFPKSVIILETREKPLIFQNFEACGLPREALVEYFANPPGINRGWNITGAQRNYIFQRLGGGHGGGAHAYGLLLLAQLSSAKNMEPSDVLRLHSYDYSETLYQKLFRDLYENVLTTPERATLFACSLYRNGINYRHLNFIEDAVNAVGTVDSLTGRRLLHEDADWVYLHDLAAEQAHKLEENQENTEKLHSIIAELWIADLKGQRGVMEANVRRALEALYHLEKSGNIVRVTEVAPDLLRRRPDEALAALWRLEKRLAKEGKKESVCEILEYILKIVPDDADALRFLGEYRRKTYGLNDIEAINLFKKAIYYRPWSPHNWSNYGAASAYYGEPYLSSFLKEILQAPKDAIDDQVISVHANALQEAGRGPEGSVLRQNKISTGTSNAAIYGDEALWLQKEKKDLKGAIEVLQKAPHDPDGYVKAILAGMLQADNKGPEASLIRTKEIASGTKNPAFYADEALWLLNEKNSPALAIEILNKAKKIGCSNRVIRNIYIAAVAALQKI